MKVSVCFRNLNARPSWQEVIEAELSRLEAFGEIASAGVSVERRRDAHPAFRVTAFLEVPGPNFHAHASDHTLQAAVLKVVEDLERQMKSRMNQQIVRHKEHGQLRSPPTRTRTLSGTRA